MPSANARKHQVPTSAENPSRAGWVLNPLLSINDVVPVTSVSDRAAVVAALPAAPSSAKPLIVLRADAPGSQRLEVTYDGTNWSPVVRFAHGTTTGGTDASGLITVTHNLGAVPTSVSNSAPIAASTALQQLAQISITSISTTQIQFVVRRASDGVALASNPVNVSWQAWA